MSLARLLLLAVLLPAGCGGIAVRTVDGVTGLPVAAADLRWSDDAFADTPAARTSSAGTATIAAPASLPASLRIRADGYAPLAVTVRPGQEAVETVLRPGWAGAAGETADGYDPARRPEPCRGCAPRSEPPQRGARPAR